MTSAHPTADIQNTDKKKKKKRSIIFLTLFLCILIPSLMFLFKDKIGFGKMKEGVIEYEVTYPEIDSENNMMAAGLPDDAKYYFKDKKSKTSLSGMMGLIEIGYIADETTKTALQSLVLFQNKYVAELDEAGVLKINSGFVKEIHLVDGEKKKIANYNCKKARAILSNGKEIDIWYTKELGSPGTNWSNPYSKLDGVLMEFEIEKYGIVMRLVATKVVSEGVSDEEFTVPSDYKKMPIEEIENIMKTLNPVK